MARPAPLFRPRARSTGVVGLLVLALFLAVLLYAQGTPSPSSSSAAPAPAAVERVPAGTLDPAAASAALAGLRVAEKGSRTGYERDCGDGDGCVFGPAWVDVDRDGCNQRDNVLHRDLVDVRVRGDSSGCVVLSGTLRDPYTGTTVRFTKEDAEQVPVDHVVPLAAAWRQGARAWTLERRTLFANDLGNLIATTRAVNSAKQDSTAEAWVPPNAGYGCNYGRVVVTVKQRYALSVTPAEAVALRGLLERC